MIIAVIDYGMGNLHSVSKALQKVGGHIRITQSAKEIRGAAGVVLPGVGAFGEAMRRLQGKRLLDPILQALQWGKPFLGICLGLQLLFERSEESPREKGLGFFKGPVVRFKFSRRSSLKVPHMGWNTFERGPAGNTPYLRGISKRDHFYFVHSYFPAPEDKRFLAARTRYGTAFCSAVARGPLFACQFHPEKSGDQGQRLLRNFVQTVASCS